MDSNFLTQNLQPDIYAALIVTTTLALVAVSLRFFARRLVRADLWLDDWLSLLALLTTLGFDINIHILVKHGVGRHIETIKQDSTTIYRNFFVGLWVGELFYTFALAPAKLSFLAFYWRIFQVSSIRLPIKIMVVVVALWSIIRVAMTVFHCYPIQGYWDKSIQATCNINDQKYFGGSVTTHLMMDIIILAIPVPYIQKLHMSLYQKLSILVMFLFGGFICFATIIQIVICFKVNVTSPDVTWTFARMVLWATVEVNLAVMAGCLPSLRPIYRMVINRSLKNLQSAQESGYNSTGRNGRSHLHTVSIGKGTDSDSTKRFAVREGDGNYSFAEAIDAHSRSTNVTCELDIINTNQVHEGRNAIMVKKQVNVVSSACDSVPYT